VYLRAPESAATLRQIREVYILLHGPKKILEVLRHKSANSEVRSSGWLYLKFFCPIYLLKPVRPSLKLKRVCEVSPGSHNELPGLALKRNYTCFLNDTMPE